jgi:hypothetical protein|uniref:Ig-like domain protein n=1 Tax=Myoviridae sp. ctshb19 TaxID=2825194 RepID=A0A8S5UG96_9CAUD|nr:MAG TPA: Ig-like domain protein [Myoviridae sp. ctshb19]
MTLTEFIDEKIAVALNYRGLSKFNPVEIIVEGNGKKFVVLVSLLEPDTLTVPYNVSWINADPEHEDYKVLQRRVDAEKYDDKNYRGSWAVLSTVEEIFTEEQYFKKDADPILGAVPDFRPPLAAKTRLGGFTLSEGSVQEDADDPVVIYTNDPRMSDPREPLPHSHPDFPRTILSAGDGSENYVIVSGSEPAPGSMLFITEELAGGNFKAEWLPPTTEFAYLGPRPTSISVVGPTEKVNGNSNHILRADVNMDDGQKLTSVKATWTTTVNGEFGTVNPATGVFHANPVAVDTPVTVRATWTHEESGVTVTQDYVITINGDPSIVILQSIRIVGPVQFLKSETGTYTVEATYSDGSKQTVTPNAFVSSNTQAGTFSNGILTPRQSQVRDVSTTLTATFVQGGVTRTGTLNVTIKDPAIYPNSIVINGANSVDQDSTSTYVGRVTFSDGTTSDVTAAWTVTATTYATIGAATGVLTAKPLVVPGSKSVEINVSYTANGQTVTAKKTVAIADTKNWPVSGAITGPNTLAPLETQLFTYAVTYADGSVVNKTPVWSSSDTSKATVATDGNVTGVADGATNIRATYSEDGVNLNATKAITVATGTVVIPPLRYGVAMFSNVNFTGGPIANEITQEERDYGVTEETSPSGKQYTHWTGLDDFVSSVMTNTLELQPGELAKNIETTITVDEYVYLMWDARAGDTFIIDLQNSFNVTFDGINYRNDVLGNEDGLPGYDPNLPKQLTVQYDDGTGVRPWIIVRNEATTLPEFSPRTNQYSIKYD